MSASCVVQLKLSLACVVTMFLLQFVCLLASILFSHGAATRTSEAAIQRNRVASRKRMARLRRSQPKTMKTKVPAGKYHTWYQRAVQREKIFQENNATPSRLCSKELSNEVFVIPTYRRWTSFQAIAGRRRCPVEGGETWLRAKSIFISKPSRG